MMNMLTLPLGSMIYDISVCMIFIVICIKAYLNRF